MGEVRALSWYELHTGAIVAIVESGMFMLPVGGTEWTWYPTGSDGWDAMHQRIFRQFHADTLDGPPPLVPPLPHTVQNVAVLDVNDLGNMRTNPVPIQWIIAGASMRRTAFVVLSEDFYETAMGDGLFRDEIGCFPSEQAAQECECGFHRHVRRIELRVENGEVMALPEREDFADRYSLRWALTDLVKRLQEA